jgi:hypothetical protein
MHERNNIFHRLIGEEEKKIEQEKKSRKSLEDEMHDCTDLDGALVSANNKHTFYYT